MRVRAAFVLRLVPLVLVAGCLGGEARLNRARDALSAGKPALAERRYAALCDGRDGDPRLQIRACLGAARAAAALRDGDAERRFLERAADLPEVPGLSAEAYFALAERLREGDHARALNFYYRAAAAAQRDQRRDLYERSVAAIARLGMSE